MRALISCVCACVRVRVCVFACFVFVCLCACVFAHKHTKKHTRVRVLRVFGFARTLCDYFDAILLRDGFELGANSWHIIIRLFEFGAKVFACKRLIGRVFEFGARLL